MVERVNEFSRSQPEDRSSEESVEEDKRMLTEYGEFMVVLDADYPLFREAISNSSTRQLIKVLGVLEENINDCVIHGNDDVVRHLLYKWLYVARLIEEDVGEDGLSELRYSERYKEHLL